MPWRDGGWMRSVRARYRRTTTLYDDFRLDDPQPARRKLTLWLVDSQKKATRDGARCHLVSSRDCFRGLETHHMVPRFQLRSARLPRVKDAPWLTSLAINNRAPSRRRRSSLSLFDRRPNRTELRATLTVEMKVSLRTPIAFARANARGESKRCCCGGEVRRVSYALSVVPAPYVAVSLGSVAQRVQRFKEAVAMLSRCPSTRASALIRTAADWRKHAHVHCEHTHAGRNG